MTLNIAIQMDPIEHIDIKGDSTFALALAAQGRGHQLWYYLPQSLALRAGTVTARAWPLTVQDRKEAHYTRGERTVLDLKKMDVVLLRQDPPFHMGYITTTHILEHVHPKPLVVNDPVHVRNAPEKLLVMHYPELMPPTLITADPDEIRAFRAEFKDIVIKPLFGNGGEGVVRLREDDQNLASLLELFGKLYDQPVMVQAYLKDVTKGDKRIILVEGEPVAALNRVPGEGELRSNMHVGGRPELSTLTERDKEICTKIGPMLKDKGQIFVGIDVIGDYLTEINLTSPTGIREVKRFGGPDVAELVWDAIEARRGD